MKKVSVKRLVAAALMTTFLSVVSMISIPIGPVSLTLSLVGVFLIGNVLSPGYAVLSVVCYLLIGAVGVPVFSNFRSGPTALFGPTGGYLMAYVLMVFIISFSVKHFPKHDWLVRIVSMLVSLVVCYLFGSLWYMLVAKVTASAAFLTCVVPFIGVDILKMVFTLLVVQSLKRFGKLSAVFS